MKYKIVFSCIWENKWKIEKYNEILFSVERRRREVNKQTKNFEKKYWVKFWTCGTGTHYEDLILSNLYTNIYLSTNTLRWDRPGPTALTADEPASRID